MVASAIRLQKHPTEEPAEYVRRRGAAAKQICNEKGKWSAHWFQRVLNWDAHVARPRNSHTWAAKPRDFHGRDWLMQRRILFAPAVSNHVSILLAER